ncbi:MAG: RES domain-containing protein, partial [Cyanobium sp.]
PSEAAMRVYRASRRPLAAFDPLDASSSVERDGWRFNDKRTAIPYTAEVQSLAILEVVSRPGWNMRPAAARTAECTCPL